jgi:ribonuclease Z
VAQDLFKLTDPQDYTISLLLHDPTWYGRYKSNLTRQFLLTSLRSDSLRLNAVENGADASQPIYKDENLTVYAVHVYANETPSDVEKTSSGSPSLKRKRLSVSKDSPSPKRLSISGESSGLHKYRESPFRLQNEEAESWRRLVIARMFPGKEGTPFNSKHAITSRHLKNRLPSWSHRPVATSYLGFGPEYRGKFNSAIADSLGVPPGRDRGRLAKGESITLPDGRVITPDMVVGSSSPAIVRPRRDTQDLC